MSRRLLTMLGIGLFAASVAMAQNTSPSGSAQDEKKPEEEGVKKSEEVLGHGRHPVETELINSPATLSVDHVQEAGGVRPPRTTATCPLRPRPERHPDCRPATSTSRAGRAPTPWPTPSSPCSTAARSTSTSSASSCGTSCRPNIGDIKQIEVVRGPASAVWGANALTGVVNIITKIPARCARARRRPCSGGLFDRDAGLTARRGRGGQLRSATSASAAPPTTRWSYRLSGGYFNSDAASRAHGPDSGASRRPRATPGHCTVGARATRRRAGRGPRSRTSGTSQPKFDLRVDQELTRTAARITYQGGVAGTEGIIHTGIGPFDMQSGSYMGYGEVSYGPGRLRLGRLRQHRRRRGARTCCCATRTAEPLSAELHDPDLRHRGRKHATSLGGKHILTYGGNSVATTSTSRSPQTPTTAPSSAPTSQDEYLLEPVPLRARRAASTSSATSTTRSSRPRVSVHVQADAATTPSAPPSTAPSARRPSSTTTSDQQISSSPRRRPQAAPPLFAADPARSSRRPSC